MLQEYLEKCKSNVIIADAFTKADSVINNPKYTSAICSISGGSDSDIMLDIISKVDVNKKVQYVWFNTGLEYQATKDHLEYLENWYDITIHRERERLNQYLYALKNLVSHFSVNTCQI